jgi:hypothetical protein
MRQKKLQGKIYLGAVFAGLSVGIFVGPVVPWLRCATALDNSLRKPLNPLV